MLKVYSYEKCSTCKKALNWLTARGAHFEVLPIVEKPPSIMELRTMLAHVGELKRLFNTSGELYREMKMSERLPEMKEDEALELLSRNGKLIKRPFILSSSAGCVGFKEEEWASKF